MLHNCGDSAPKLNDNGANPCADPWHVQICGRNLRVFNVGKYTLDLKATYNTYLPTLLFFRESPRNRDTQLWVGISCLDRFYLSWSPNGIFFWLKNMSWNNWQNSDATYLPVDRHNFDMVLDAGYKPRPEMQMTNHAPKCLCKPYQNECSMLFGGIPGAGL